MTKQLFASLLAVVAIALGTQANAAFVDAPSAAADGTAAAFYNPLTGEFTYSIGSGVSIIGVETAGLVKLGLEPRLNTKVPDQYDANVLAYFDFAAPLPVGIWSQGLVFAPGLAVSANGEATDIPFGYQASGIDYVVPVNVVGGGGTPVIPEPATLGMMGLALIGATFIRRR